MIAAYVAILWFLVAPPFASASSPEPPPSTAAESPACSPVTLARVVWRDDGSPASSEPRELLGPNGPDLCVVAFVTTTCPIANASLPAMQRLGHVVRAAGGVFVLVHPDPLATPDRVRKHAVTRGLEIESLLDPDHRMVDRLGATVVPEVFVLERVDGAWKTRYRGPVDDLYAGVGRRRRAATTAFALEAIRSVRAGNAVVPPVRPAHGCVIERMRP